ncbi:MAG: MBOAT family protein, partial [Chitinispirillaceae bacterium]|nr:MBOAT family protein [Chitinispirillaceae bacterium]
ISTAVDYTAGKLITRTGATQRQKNGALVMSCISNLGMLGFFKYFMFAAGGINRLTALFGGGAAIPVLQITLPIGISFYTFQTMSYTIDVWRGEVPPAKNLATFSCFVALFPQLIAGPIVRYIDVAQQLDKRKSSLEVFSAGAGLFILGLSKKILLANPAGLVADAVFRADAPTVVSAWWGALAYHFQIYFDFCGYSDMAVGLGRMFGFEFIKNFNAPYHSVSITDFWRRWHISLSTWIRDYLYIPLGGNRRGAGHTYVNLLISFFLCGLWHGAKTTFVCWGLFQGVFLILERLRGKKSLYGGLPAWAAVVVTNLIVLFGWVLFRAPDLPQALRYWRAMTGTISTGGASLLLQAELFSTQHMATMSLCAIFIWQPVQAYEWVARRSTVKYIVLASLFVLAAASMFTQAFNPFLYFQF